MIIRWTDAAVRDFIHICDYIEEHRSAAAARRVALPSMTASICLQSSLNTAELGESRIPASLFLAACRILPCTVFAETR